MTEDEHQEKIFEWADAHLEEYPQLEFMYANMNGVRRSKKYTSKLKRRGMRAGVPDMFLPVARWGFHGLYIELKRPKGHNNVAGKTSPKQKKWIKFLIDQGYSTHVCFGYLRVIELIKYYLEKEETYASS